MNFVNLSLFHGLFHALYASLTVPGLWCVMRAKDLALPAIALGLAAGYAYSALPSSALQSGDQRARIERGDEAACRGEAPAPRKACPAVR